MTEAMAEVVDNSILHTDKLCRSFSIKSGGLLASQRREVKAVNDVSISVDANETLALVGESGSGKTTLSRLLLLLDQPSGGSVFFRGQDLAHLSKAETARYRREVQPVFQNPYASLNPRMRIKTIVAEPLIVSARGEGLRLSKRDIAERVAWALDATGLRPEDGEKFPHQFSGGQRQRIAIARAIACRPKLIILDEAVSSQDISIQAQILNLLKDLQEELAMSYLFIAHDLATVRFMSDRVAVMYQGKIVEYGASEALFENPRHPYTQALFAANLPAHPKDRCDAPSLQGAMMDADPGGCGFYKRCPQALAHCKSQSPELQTIKNDHDVSCFVAVKDAVHA